MTILAVFTVALALGTWLGVRLADANRRLDDVVATILSTPLPDPSASAAHDLGAADIGARAGTPLPGAGPTPILPGPGRTCWAVSATGAGSPQIKEAAGARTPTANSPQRESNAVSDKHLTVIWTPAEMRALVTAARAAAAPELGVTAPVIDIKTRKRIA